MHRLWAFIISDTWQSHLSRLLSITAIFLAFYSIDSFATWFDANVVSGVIGKALFVAALFFLTSWVVEGAHFRSRIIPEIDTLRRSADEQTAQIERLTAQASPVAPDKAFSDGISVYAASLATAGRDRHVLRLRDALSRYLWVEGLLKARLAIGEAAESAAARLGQEVSRMGILIDDLGWTLVAQEEREKAREKIHLGLSIAERQSDSYWLAKARRHLAGIATIERNFPLAKEELKLSEEAAKEIGSEAARNEMIAGIHYAVAVTLLYEGKYEDALKAAEESEGLRTESGDQTRAVRSYSLKGKILLRMGDTNSRGDAKAIFLRGLKEAEGLGRRDEIIRNLSGLAAVFDSEGDEHQALSYREKAAIMLEETPVPYELIDKA